MDWLARGLPWEGTRKSATYVVDLAQPDVPTCRLSDPVDEVNDRVHAAGWNLCVVVNDKNIVMGVLEDENLDADSSTLARSVMACAPRTYRPQASIERAVNYMQKYERDHVLVSTGDGELMGLVWRTDAESALEHSGSGETGGSGTSRR